MAESLLETDVVKIFVDNKDNGYYLVKKIVPDVKPGWWAVTFQVINIPGEFTWLLDNDQIAQGEFTMKDIPMRIELYARILCKPVEKKSSSLSEIKSIF